MAGLIGRTNKKAQFDGSNDTCKVCGLKYIRFMYKQKFCSRSCATKWWGRFRNRRGDSLGVIYEKNYKKVYMKSYNKKYRLKHLEYYSEYAKQYQISKNIINEGGD